VDHHQLPADQAGLAEERELLPELGLGALGGVADEPAALADRGDDGAEVGQVVGDDGPHPDEVLVGAEAFGVDVADQLPVRRGRPPRVSLDAGGAADQGPGLDIGQQGPAGGGPQQPRRGADRGGVGVGVDPLVVGGPGDGAVRLGPQREAVVEQVVV
jgi:hypothetical protein